MKYCTATERRGSYKVSIASGVKQIKIICLVPKVSLQTTADSLRIIFYPIPGNPDLEVQSETWEIQSSEILSGDSDTQFNSGTTGLGQGQQKAYLPIASRAQQVMAA